MTKEEALRQFRQAYGFGPGVCFIPVGEVIMGTSASNVYVEITAIEDQPGIAELIVKQ